MFCKLTDSLQSGSVEGTPWQSRRFGIQERKAMHLFPLLLVWRCLITTPCLWQSGSARHKLPESRRVQVFLTFECIWDDCQTDWLILATHLAHFGTTTVLHQDSKASNHIKAKQGDAEWCWATSFWCIRVKSARKLPQTHRRLGMGEGTWPSTVLKGKPGRDSQFVCPQYPAIKCPPSWSKVWKIVKGPLGNT